MVGPFALRGRHESALERRVTRRGERIHQRLADDRRRILDPGQLDPGRICIHDDAFLHVHDRVGRTGHEGLHLVAILVRGGERAGERTVEPGEMKLALGHGPEPLPCLERYHVARAKLERAVQTVLADRVAHQDDRDRARVRVAQLERGRGILGVGQAYERELGLALLQRITVGGQIAHPGAMHRVACVTQGAIDDLDGFLVPRKDDERDRARLGQVVPARCRSS